MKLVYSVYTKSRYECEQIISTRGYTCSLHRHMPEKLKINLCHVDQATDI